MIQCLAFSSLKAKLIPTPGPLHMSFLPGRFFPGRIPLARPRPSKHFNAGTSLAVQWLGLRVSTSRDIVSIPSWGTKIMQSKTKQNPQIKNTPCKHHIFRRLLKSSSTPSLPTSSLLLFPFITFFKHLLYVLHCKIYFIHKSNFSMQQPWETFVT